MHEVALPPSMFAWVSLYRLPPCSAFPRVGLLMLMSCLWLMAGPGVRASPATQTSTLTLLSPLPQVGELALSSRYVAWTATQLCTGQSSPVGCSPRAVYLYDMQGRRTTVVARTSYGATGAIYHYHVSDRWLVYLDTGLHGSPATGAWRIVTLDLATRKATVLAESGRADTVAVPPDLALAGATLVWTSGRVVGPAVVQSVVSVTDLTTRKTLVLARTATPYSFSFPSTDGQRAVWERDDFTSSRPSSAVFGSDLARRQPSLRLLSSKDPTSSLASQPVVRGKQVVWKSGPGFAPGAIMLRSWDDAIAPRQLSAADEPAFNPVIGDGFVAWATGSTGQTTVYDLHTGRATRAGRSGVDWIYGFPTTAGHWLAYSYMTGVPPHQGSLPPRGYITLFYLGPGADLWQQMLAGG